MEDADNPNKSIPKNIQSLKVSALKNINLNEAVNMMYKQIDS